MYRGASAAFYEELKKASRIEHVRGSIGGVYFDDSNIVSLHYSNRCSDTSDISFGYAYIGQVNITFIDINILRGSWRNKAISDPYEPGSVFKIITLSAALDSNAITVNDTYDCPGYIEVGDRKISCWKTYGHGHQTLGEAIQNSCNPAFICLCSTISLAKSSVLNTTARSRTFSSSRTLPG